ncbi:GNAT family N-acetyltransferase [Halococcoides cellulosivorans]|uniref:Ribosomal-protein-alanine N-acetyltransferase RimI n=1 Tax=Halococcoides cellulosivorans TaxID=1679096 RepID=A0A2R4X346_9EURY|nr:GNAT family N-acetyltransferase [Halococcoides cellulosivorans]AWB28220.1 ribosomal-protein-alanine N-acetyltransferase RimI [Halococcoides cellulosivorans]
MSDSPVVRGARRRDLDAVAAIERASFDAPWPREAFAALVDAPGFLVYDRRDAIEGFVVGTLESCPDGPCGHIKDLAVAPAARGAGVGRHLCGVATERLHDAGAGVVGLEVRPSNAAAIACYRAVGYREHGREAAYYEDGEDAVLFVHRRSG